MYLKLLLATRILGIIEIKMYIVSNEKIIAVYLYFCLTNTVKPKISNTTNPDIAYLVERGGTNHQTIH